MSNRTNEIIHPQVERFKYIKFVSPSTVSRPINHIQPLILTSERFQTCSQCEKL